LEQNGIDSVLINVHHLHEKVEAFVESFESDLHIDCVFERQLLGSAGTVASHRDFVSNDKDFLIVYADNLTNAALGDFIAFHRASKASLTLGVTVTDRPSEKGIVVAGEGGLVLDFQEKPDKPRSNLANAGIYAATPRLFEYLPTPAKLEIPLDFGFDVLPRMLGRIYAFELDGFLMDIGTPSTYTQAQADWPGL
jgi:mannose-1-phosphate guanylyltransferase